MTTLYRPVLIESAEQAEALPGGTFVPRANGRLPKKRGDGTWGDQWGDCGLFDVIGYTAFVPIEAEEGTDTIQTGAEHFYTRTRYITPWEEA